MMKKMNPKLITFLLTLSFLFLFTGLASGEDINLEPTYWDNGNLKSKFQLDENGDGLVTEWYESGGKKYTTHYKNGIEDGFRTEWSKDGKKIFQGTFKDGNEQ